MTSEVDPPFWRPEGVELLRILGWRNIFFLPAILCVGLVLAAFVIPPLFTLIILGSKLLLLALVIPVGLAAYAIRAAVQGRRDPFCLHCGYSLNGLPAVYRCPECGRPYDVRYCEDYQRDPAWFAERFRQMRRNPPQADTIVIVPAGTQPSRFRDGT
jgi:hypothetical protein